MRITYGLSLILKKLGGEPPKPVSEEQYIEAIAEAIEMPNFHPVEKTEEMTCPVGVDENGQLWTAQAPSGGLTSEVTGMDLSTPAMRLSSEVVRN